MDLRLVVYLDQEGFGRIHAIVFEVDREIGFHLDAVARPLQESVHGQLLFHPVQGKDAGGSHGLPVRQNGVKIGGERAREGNLREPVGIENSVHVAIATGNAGLQGPYLHGKFQEVAGQVQCAVQATCFSGEDAHGAHGQGNEIGVAGFCDEVAWNGGCGCIRGGRQLQVTGLDFGLVDVGCLVGIAPFTGQGAQQEEQDEGDGEDVEGGEGEEGGVSGHMILQRVGYAYFGHTCGKVSYIKGPGKDPYVPAGDTVHYICISVRGVNN